MSNVYFPLSLVGTFCAIFLVSLLVARAKVQREAVVSLLETQAGRTVNLRDQELTRSFGSRAMFPVLAKLRALGLRLTPAGLRGRLERKLRLAGTPAGWDAAKLGAVKIVGGAVFGFWGLFLASRLDLGGVRAAALLVVMVFFGYEGPDAILAGRIRRRQDQVQMALPDTIDLLSISVEAGLGFDAALAQAARHIPGPLSQELRRMLQEIQLGLPRSTAFKNLSDRTDVDELNGFVLAMIQADVFGVSVSNVLRAQAKELRLKRRQRAEHRAMQVPVKILFPMILCVLPSLFVVVLGPGAIRVFNSLFGGHL